MGLFSKLFGTSDNDAGMADYQKGIDAWNSVRVPTPEELYYEIERYTTEAGIQNPAQLFTGDLNQGDTELGNVQVRQDILDRQNDSLQDLSQIAEEGYTAQEQADINKTMTQESTRQKGARDSIMQNAAERGASGGGLELQNQLLNQQASANRGSQSSFDIAAAAKQRALQALNDQGSLSSRMRQQDYGEQANRATAQDSINRFNSGLEANTRLMNNNRNWDASMLRQDINNRNADKSTAQRAQVGDNLKYGAGMDMQKAAGKSGQYQNMGNQKQQASQAATDRFGNLVSAAATAAGAYMTGGASLAADAATKGFADGGTVPDDEAFMVGEEGPELMIAPQGGEVISNPDTNKIMESITGMKSSNESELMEKTVIDLQTRLRNLEMNRGAI